MYIPGNTRVGIGVGVEAGVGAQTTADVNVRILLPLVGVFKTSLASSSLPIERELWQV